MTGRIISGVAVLAFAVGVLVSGTAFAQEKVSKATMSKYSSGDKNSGYLYSKASTRAMQDDDFANPGFLWMEQGEQLWTKVDGKAGKACATCHGDVKKMKGVGATFPKYNKEAKTVINLEQRINKCRKDNMQAKPWKWESGQLLSMTALVKSQSRGMPSKVSNDGPARPYYEAGKKFYNQRRGLLDLACSSCHVDNAGKIIRADLLSQGQSNGFPTYRLKWQKVGSLHRRFRGCNKNIRAQPYKAGSQEYVNVELYLGHRGNGLLIEAPSVRR
ncbi:MAG: sulfur oxidation c-type cytochrome SoxA [Alphaproteobacteria bacterium]|jgi:sulfur-oxidizing protein SoxA